MVAIARDPDCKQIGKGFNSARDAFEWIERNTGVFNDNEIIFICDFLDGDGATPVKIQKSPRPIYL